MWPQYEISEMSVFIVTLINIWRALVCSNLVCIPLLIICKIADYCTVAQFLRLLKYQYNQIFAEIFSVYKCNLGSLRRWMRHCVMVIEIVWQTCTTRQSRLATTWWQLSQAHLLIIKNVFSFYFLRFILGVFLPLLWRDSVEQTGTKVGEIEVRDQERSMSWDSNSERLKRNSSIFQHAAHEAINTNILLSVTIILIL